MFNRLLSAAVASATIALTAAPTAAPAQPIRDPVPIGPKQHFAGVVNGSSSAAVIEMACFGPEGPAELGHPLAGQSLEVQLGQRRAPGFTADARRIAATISYPSGTAAPTVLASLTSYFVPSVISTALSFPCGGTGTVTFRPLAGGASARSAVVTVSFSGQP